MEDLRGLIASNLWLVVFVIAILITLYLYALIALTGVATKLKKLQDQLKTNQLHIENEYEKLIQASFQQAFKLLTEEVAKKIKKYNIGIDCGISLGKIIQREKNYFDFGGKVGNGHLIILIPLLNDLRTFCENETYLWSRIEELKNLIEKSRLLINPTGDRILDLRNLEKLAQQKIKEFENLIESIASNDITYHDPSCGCDGCECEHP